MVKKNKHILLLLTILIAFAQESLAQYSEYPFVQSYYNVVQYDSNKLNFPAGKTNFDILYNKLNELIANGNSQINIVQYGGSHIQADVFSGECRKRFQFFEGGLNAGRGFVYPYRLAHTNTPYGYYFRYSGKWETCRNVQKKKVCDLGMAGISSTTTDSLSSLTLLIEPENDLDYSFNQIKIYHSIDSNSFSIRIDSNLVDSQRVYIENGYTQFYFNKYVDSLCIEFVQTDSSQTHFKLFGMNIANRDPGVIYHNMGINGAATTSFIRCNRMELDLKSIRPDLVIFGIGINDAYGNKFSQKNFEKNYDILVERVLQANPDAAIIFATNNDSYYRKRYVNRNGIKVQESMYHLAKKYNAAVWDMFEIMGGLNSVVGWQRSHLARRDKVHFTRTGYILLGDLLFEAIIEDYGKYIYKQNTNSEKSDVLKAEIDN